MLTFLRPNTSRVRVAAALGLSAALFLTLCLPSHLSAQRIDTQIVQSASPIRSAVPAAQDAKTTKAAAKKTKVSRSSGFRAPSRRALKLIKSIPRRVSSGFEPSVNGFSFANWSTETSQPIITVETLVRMFGTSSTCTSVVEGICVPSDDATALVNRLNEYLTYGRCEGMVALADELFRNPSTISSITSETSNISDLSAEVASSEIATWWATQIMPDVSKAAKKSRKLTPTQIVKRISVRMKQKSGGTLGMYYKGKGHAVLPIAITRSKYRAKISVYDSNFPNTIQVVRVNLLKNTWRYRAVSSDGTVALNWNGKNSGGLDFVSPQDRKNHQVTSLSIITPQGVSAS